MIWTILKFWNYAQGEHIPWRVRMAVNRGDLATQHEYRANKMKAWTMEKIIRI